MIIYLFFVSIFDTIKIYQEKSTTKDEKEQEQRKIAQVASNIKAVASQRRGAPFQYVVARG